MEMLKSWKGKELPMLIMPQPIAEMHYPTIGWYMPGDRTPKPKWLRQAQKNKVDFYEKTSLNSVSHLTSFSIPGIRRKQNIDYEEKLYAKYRSLYYFTCR